MQYFLAFIFIVVVILGVSIYYWWREAKLQTEGQRQRSHRNQQLALEQNPQWQAKIAADRAYQLAMEKSQQERTEFEYKQQTDIARHTLEIMRFEHQRWTDLHVIESDRYLVNTHIESMQAFPSLKVASPAKVDATSSEQAALQVPARYDLREVWQAFAPSSKQIFLGRSAQGDIIVPGNKLLHCVATGPTGGGKTNTVRMVLMQLVYIGCQVTLCDIHYAPIKEDEDGNPIDWRPIIDNLARPPIYDLSAIIKWMNWLAFSELESRIAKQRNGQPIGVPIFFTIAELPAVLDEAGKEIAQPLAKILRQGRQYLIFFVGDSQDLLTNTLHMTTGPRECFRTGYYTGGDPTTAKALLDLPKGVTLDETGIGQGGLMYLKTAIHPYQLARVGWASNEALYDLFETPASERIGYASGRYAPVQETFTRRAETPDEERMYSPFSERPDGEIIDADLPETDPLHEQHTNVRTFPQSRVSEPVESMQPASEERLKYTLNDTEIDQFKAAYKASGNIDKALAAIGKGSNYRSCARRIIEVYALRKEEA